MTEACEHRSIAHARIGRRIGADLRLDRLLGVGGMAAVYEATDRNGKRVAVKVLHRQLSGSPRQRKRFLREVYVASAIGHPGVVEIHGDGVEGDETYLVMEVLEGETVAALQRRLGGKLDLDRALDIADQLLSVLTAAHARGVIHRDIKPENLFLESSGRLKVLDFGVARLFQPLPGWTTDTQVGATLGTPAFMPQEQARGRWDEVDQRSDLWAVGATLFTLVTGEHVHEGETPNEQLGRAMSLPARSLGELSAELPPAFIAAVDRALRYDPAERWQDAGGMQAALRAVRDGTTDAASAAASAALADRDELRSASTDAASIAPRLPSRTAVWRVRIGAAALAVALAVATSLPGRVGTKDARADGGRVTGSRSPGALPVSVSDASRAARPAAEAPKLMAHPDPPAPVQRRRPAPRKRGTEAKPPFDLLDVRH